MMANKPDRRVQRTRQLLHTALVELVQEKGFDAITIQDITERANLGRTTFYLHYLGKEELMLDHHATLADMLGLKQLTRADLLAEEPPPGLVTFLTLVAENPRFYEALVQARGADLILRGVREQMMANLEGNLHAAFPGLEPTMPMALLKPYLINAQLAFVDWWVRSAAPYTPHQLATTIHQLQRSLLRDVYRLE
jgi:AcrR family transcriptional regulator